MADIMTAASMPLVIIAALMGGLAILSRAVLAGWRDWISLKRDELAAAREAGLWHQSAGRGPALPDNGPSAVHADDLTTMSAATRIDLADMRERLRKLEAIAAGVDL
ncbi:hypothetical protein [Sphingopyxis yananensis]|uniref:hypothetical protein n=1 Tax=Sphingopyxis yananensis TaxID=2886687 RepID=UPI001D0FAF7E|nr:hypothetical protein [Sphingopyxis yananensis]MCC2602908.1 hypothetical protein [Sphingopyxis yananensis]